jgi:hypothetical protein
VCSSDLEKEKICIERNTTGEEQLPVTEEYDY